MIDNLSIAIMSMLNTLAERYGLRPHEVLAILDAPSVPDVMYLRLISPPHPDDLATAARFERLRASLGLQDDSLEVAGTGQEILSTLTRALQHAPKSSSGRRR